MARRRGLSAKQLAALPRRSVRYTIGDPETRGLYLRIPPAGPINFTVIVKKNLQQTWESIGTTDDLTIEDARDRARAVIRRIKSGEPAPTPPQSVAAVARTWLARYVDKNALRTAYEYRRIVEHYIVPHLGDRDFIRLRRSDIVAFLDLIEDRHGAHQADAVLAMLRSIAGWVQSRSDDYMPPFSRGMRRVPAHQRQRSRVLSDNELRAVWQAADDAGLLGDVIKLLLLTAQRREKIYTLKWSDIADGVWTMPHVIGEKGVGGRLRLPPLALAIIDNQARISDFVFPHRPAARTKAHFEQRAGVRFRLHDLRRTSRTLLSRIGVSFDVAEAILGHKAKGVAGVYDRYDRETEKGAALARLAATIQQIVDPVDNVVALEAGAAS
jgi:integrase